MKAKLPDNGRCVPHLTTSAETSPNLISLEVVKEGGDVLVFPQ